MKGMFALHKKAGRRYQRFQSMKKIIVCLCCLCFVTGCSSYPDAQDGKEITQPNEIESQEHEPKRNEIEKERDEMHHITITIKGQSFSAELYDTKSVRAFMERLPMTLTMEDLHHNEKYAYVDSFPVSPQSVSQIHTGDIKLFGNDCLVLFYQDFSTSYSYTSLGTITDPKGLSELLGSGSTTISFEKD